MSDIQREITRYRDMNNRQEVIPESQISDLRTLARQHPQYAPDIQGIVSRNEENKIYQAYMKGKKHPSL